MKQPLSQSFKTYYPSVSLSQVLYAKMKLEVQEICWEWCLWKIKVWGSRRTQGAFRLPRRFGIYPRTGEGVLGRKRLWLQHGSKESLSAGLARVLVYRWPTKERFFGQKRPGPGTLPCSVTGQGCRRRVWLWIKCCGGSPRWGRCRLAADPLPTPAMKEVGAGSLWIYPAQSLRQSLSCSLHNLAHITGVQLPFLELLLFIGPVGNVIVIAWWGRKNLGLRHRKIWIHITGVFLAKSVLDQLASNASSLTSLSSWNEIKVICWNET